MFDNKAFTGLSSIALLIAAACLLFFHPDSFNDQIHSHGIISALYISMFNVVILLAWIAFGPIGGTVMSVLSTIAAFFIILKMGCLSNIVFVLPYLAAALIGYNFHNESERIDRVNALNSEKLSEETNVLSNDMAKTEKSVASLEEKLRRYSTLKEVAEAFGTVLLEDEINRLIVKKARSILGDEGRIMLFLVDRRKGELFLAASEDKVNIREKTGDVFDKWVLRYRKSLIMEDVSKDFRFSADDIENAKNSFRSLIETPLMSEDKIIGILRVDSQKESAYDHDDLRILDIIANLGAVAIDNAELYLRTQELAIRDGLTGLVVRRYFMERFNEELNRAARRKDPLSVAILDIDHFKEYNDKHGHAAGDLVLKYVAKIISLVARDGDILSRYGGEELALLLIGADKLKAAQIAESIRKRIQDEPFRLRRHIARITVSIGVSSYPEDAIVNEELIKISDDRLYKAKMGGRNKVCAN